MINIAIIGAEDPLAGEMMRILISHPEANMKLLFSPSLRGLPVSSVHHGFIGEEIVNFSDKEDIGKIDVVFLLDDSEFSHKIKGLEAIEENPKIIDLSPRRHEGWRAADIEYGLSEINRKALVRGARKAVIPSSIASLSLIGLAPLASYLLLPDNLELYVAAPEDVIQELDPKKIAEEIAQQLKKRQQSFEGNVKLRISKNNSERVMRVKTKFRCLLGIEEIQKIYDSIYDDHNFTFTSIKEVEGKEVEGTQKTIISFSKPTSDTLEIEVVGDCRLRGGAGDAVHVLNLFFNLHEKIGLELKPSRFKIEKASTSKPLSWFA